MTRRAARAVALVVATAAAILSGPVGLRAQAPAMTIDGFEGFRWGTSVEEIREARGIPVQEEPVGDNLSLIAYRDTVAGIPLVTVFGVHLEEGLLKGQYSADVEEGDDCFEMFVALREKVNSMYPLLRPVERRFHRTVDDFCEAVAIGEAGWMVQWNDPTTESFISVYIRAGTATVEVAYESKAFQNWAEQRTAGSR